MEFPSQLTQAVLLKRYKRFLAEIILNNQEHRIIYCPNMGAMMGCEILGSKIWFSSSDNPRRKFPDTWEIVEVNGGHLVCINTQYTNQLLVEAIQNKIIGELQGYTRIIPDPPLLDDNGFDLLLEREQEQENQKCFVVVKNVTLGDEIGRGFFPDAPSDKNIAQLKSLIHAKQLGYRAVLMYCAPHTGIARIFPGDHVDSEYGRVLRQAAIAGVEIIGYRAHISLEEIKITTKIEVCIPARLICNSREKSR